MIIVVEGIRKSGKSTFINAVEDELQGGAPVFRFYDRDLQTYKVNQQEANFVSCMQFIKAANEVDEKLSAQNNEPLIFFDRFHISELIFGYAYRGYDSSELMTKVDNNLAKSGARLLMFNSETSESRTDDDLFREAFHKYFAASNITMKYEINLDALGGKITSDFVCYILKNIGYFKECQ